MYTILIVYSDLEGHIVRCKERIEDNIMPSIFEDRLKQLEAKKASILQVSKTRFS